MTNTKENILRTALHLFARDGYEAVSVSAIAGALGMTKGALYKHYRSKRDIFDSIVARMYEIDAQRSRQYAVPEGTYDAAPDAYDAVSWDALHDFTLAQFTFWTRDDFACSFRRMLTLEQYRSAEMAQLYLCCLSDGPVAYTADIFRRMMAAGTLRPGDPRQLALSCYAPMLLLMTVADHTGDTARPLAQLEGHLALFRQQFVIDAP